VAVAEALGGEDNGHEPEVREDEVEEKNVSRVGGEEEGN